MKMMSSLALVASCLVWTSIACRRAPDATAPPQTTIAADPTRVEREPEQPAGKPASPDAPIAAPVVVNVEDLKWQPGPESLPPGSEVAVLEGTPPFDREQSFTVALRLPANYTIAPHQHLVTERVTVLQGRAHLGHGTNVDRTKAKLIERGGVVLLPSDHTHYAATGPDDAIVVLQSVGPWGIYYVDPKDDPRPTPAEKPRDFTSRLDAPIEPTTLNPREIAFRPAPSGLLPQGAELAILDGDPDKRQNFVMRLRVPDGYRFPVHSHSITDRFIVIEGTLLLGLGDTWQPDEMVEMRPGAVAIIPAGVKHYAQAQGETVLQVTGTGPYDISWANPEDDPARRQRQATAAP